MTVKLLLLLLLHPKVAVSYCGVATMLKSCNKSPIEYVLEVYWIVALVYKINVLSK